MSLKTQLQTALAHVNERLQLKGAESASTVYDIGSKIDTITTGSNEIIENPKKFYDETGVTVRSLAGLHNPGSTVFIAFITDSHIYTSNNNEQYFKTQMASMKAVCSAIKPDLIVHGGDITNGSESKANTVNYVKSVVKQMKEINGDNCLFLVGNHDGNTVQPQQSGESDADYVARVEASYRITEEEMKTLMKTGNDGFTYAGDNYQGGQFYGYKDFDGAGIRVIRLHSYIENIAGGKPYFGGNGGNWGYYNDELTWLQNVGLKTNYDVVILCHQTLSPILQGYAESQNIPSNGMNIQQIIDTWQTTGLTIDGSTYKGKCVGVIHGHVHWDYHSMGNKTFDVISHSDHTTHITRTGSHGAFYEYGQGFANYMPSFPTSDSVPESSYRDVPASSVFYGRSVNDETQALWTGIVINKATHTISFVRFGAGVDYSLDYTSDAVINVTGLSLVPTTASLNTGSNKTIDLTATITPSNASNTKVNWNSNNTTVATVSSSGKVTATGVGNATITATADDTTLGTFSQTCAVTVVEGRTNQIPISYNTDANGGLDTSSVYNGSGWKENYRLNSSGKDSYVTPVSGTPQAYVTGFIPCTKGTTLTFKDMQLPGVNTITHYDYCYIACYRSDGTLIKSSYAKDYCGIASNHASLTDGYVDYITMNVGVGSGVTLDDMAYVRISALYIDNSSAIYNE